MTNTKRYNNIRLFALENANDNGFDVYIGFSGNSEYLMHHRKNNTLFYVLKDGITVDELKRSKDRMVSNIALPGCRMLRGQINPRLKVRKNYSKKIENSFDHIINVVNEYIEEYTQAA